MNPPDNAVEQRDTDLVCTTCRWRAGHSPDCPRKDEPWPTFTPEASTPPPSAWSDEAGAVVEKFWRDCTDWDGTQMLDAAETLPTQTCGDLRQAATLLTTAREGWPADRARADAAEAREKALREALEPFARVANHSGSAWHDDRRLSELACPNNLTIGDCRCARAALGERS